MSERLTVSVASLLASCCLVAALVTISHADTSQPQPTMPPDWIAIPTPNDSDRACANWANREWQVGMRASAVQVSPVSETVRDALPFAISVKRGEISEIGDVYDRHVLKVDDGWIVGFDDGEWDGSLWWFSTPRQNEALFGARSRHEKSAQTRMNKGRAATFSNGAVFRASILKTSRGTSPRLLRRSGAMTVLPRVNLHLRASAGCLVADAARSAVRRAALLVQMELHVDVRELARRRLIGRRRISRLVELDEFAFFPDSAKPR